MAQIVVRDSGKSFFRKAWDWKSEVLLFCKKGRKVLVGGMQSLPQWTKLAIKSLQKIFLIMVIGPLSLTKR